MCLDEDQRRGTGRRGTDLPRRRWSGLMVAGVLGALAGALMQMRPSQPTFRPADPPARASSVLASRSSLDRAQALRDAAEALTPTQVLLDERAQETWLPIMPKLEAVAEDPETPPQLQIEVEATLTALSRAGIRR